jgi:hypothetical protein
MHQTEYAFHNLKKFFALEQRKYTDPVHKDLFVNILLSKKEITCFPAKKIPRIYGGFNQKYRNGIIV